MTEYGGGSIGHNCHHQHFLIFSRVRQRFNLEYFGSARLRIDPFLFS